MIKARLDLDSVNYTTKSNFIISKLKQHPDFIKAKTIGIYVSFRNEVNTISLIKEMLSNKNICVPKIEDKEMNFYQIKSFDELKPNYMKILEPDNHHFISMRRMHAQMRICGDNKRPDVQGCSLLRRNPVTVDLDNRFERLQKIFRGNLRNTKPLIGIIGSGDILVRTE